MVAFFVVLGIVVLASLIVLSAVVMAGRADANLGNGLSGVQRTDVRGRTVRRHDQPPAATPGNVNPIRVENGEHHQPPE